MAHNYFIWNGVSSLDKGILLDGPAPIIRPEERVKHTPIPGRSGDLTEIEGENIYNSYIQSIPIHVKSRASGDVASLDLRGICQWLRGAGYVTFSQEPTRKQQARIIGAITFEKHSRFINYWDAEVQFYCHPLKEALEDEAVTLYPPEEETETAEGGDTQGVEGSSASGEYSGAAGGTAENANVIMNRGDVIARPYIYAKASAREMTITCNGIDFHLDDTNVNAFYRIDCASMIVLKNSNLSNRTKYTSGKFPALEVGENTFTGEGWERLEITRRERYL